MMPDADPPPAATAPADNEPAAAAAASASAAPASPHAGQIRKDHNGKADSASRPSKAGTAAPGPQCESAHLMQYHLIDQSDLKCDRCNTGIPAGEMAYSCVPCNFDTCIACAHKSERRRAPRKVF